MVSSPHVSSASKASFQFSLFFVLSSHRKTQSKISCHSPALYCTTTNVLNYGITVFVNHGYYPEAINPERYRPRQNTTPDFLDQLWLNNMALTVTVTGSSALSASAAGWLLFLLLTTVTAARTATALQQQNQHHDRFGAIETSPAILGPGLSPRFYHAAAPARPLARRQAQCNPGNHPCNEIGDVGSAACCPDDSYCIINPSTTTLPACCPLGSTCNSPCQQSEYQCLVTISGTSTAQACCPRKCTSTSQFGCPLSLGGGCCSYGSVCGSPSVCLSTVAPSSSTTPLVSQVPVGCTTSQISCAASLGGGCCAASQRCTLVEGAARCADSLVTPTGSGVSSSADDGDGEGGLSAGAKAGIAIGVVFGAGLVIGAVTWFCLRRRRRKPTNPRPEGVVGTILGASGGREPGSVTDDRSEMVEHAAGGGGDRSVQRHGPGAGGGGNTTEYFGGDPAIGPYSDEYFGPSSEGTTPGTGIRSGGGVPVAPHSPGDIAVPVEIDSSHHEPRDPGAAGTVDGRFELYGSDLLGPGSWSGTSPAQGNPVPSPVTPVVPSPLDETPQSGVSDERSSRGPGVAR
ncbi:hypothetical protein QBC47DRAFT_393874 [Echria macrotheca]|uniref:Uncharacterized protein n=1 Tax=Echria macrotheca TaxID=438768 RepID=A0AAJ0F0Y5_9PEZI|nr:hypothetical protein QBC47DRAFT_393874 [Echria macrotheca]